MTHDEERPIEDEEPAADQPEPVADQPEPAADEPEPAPPAPKKAKSPLREWAETIIVALLVALVVRTFVVQVYLVRGESMEPGLHTDERLLVNKFIYRFRSPAPGEVIVLQDPSMSERELIKRVIAVAGETVEVRQGVVYINDQPLKESYKNTLYTQYADTPPKLVPEGSIYVMGDNRGRSLDSRLIGAIPLNKVDGKAFFMFWPLNRFASGPLEQGRTFDDGAK